MAEITFGIKECSKCEYYLRCEECVYKKKDIETIIEEKQNKWLPPQNEINKIRYEEKKKVCQYLYEFFVKHFNLNEQDQDKLALFFCDPLGVMVDNKKLKKGE